MNELRSSPRKAGKTSSVPTVDLQRQACGRGLEAGRAEERAACQAPGGRANYSSLNMARHLDQVRVAGLEERQLGTLWRSPWPLLEKFC